MRLLAAIIVLAALGVTAPALAQVHEDAPVSTASAVSSAPTTAEQIEQYLASSPARASGVGPTEDLDEPAPRKIHGEHDQSVGTGGYRSGHVSAVIPIGERGTLGLSYGQTDFGKGGGYGYGYGYGAGGPGYGGGYGGRGYPPMSFDASRGRYPDDPTDCVSTLRDGASYLETTELDRARSAAGLCPLR
jgi:hypothetical protein